jgi:excisionase family DNA binding protein
MPAGNGEDGNRLIGTREAARRLRVHENTIRNWADTGVLPCARRLPGSRFRRFRIADVEALRDRTPPEENT